MARGVPDASMILEDDASSTIGNFQNSAKMIDPAEPVVFISSGYHMERAVKAAKKAGFTNIKRLPAPSPFFEYGENMLSEVVLTINELIKTSPKKKIDTLTYAVFSYLPDSEYYQEIIESRWAEVEPDIKLVRADWDCYYDGAPEGMDETLVVNSENSDNRPQYAIEVVADTKGEANPSASVIRKIFIAYTRMRLRSLPGSKASGMRNVWN